MKLEEQICKPLQKGMLPLTREEAEILLKDVPEWDMKDKSIERVFQFKDFEKAMGFVKEVAEIAQQQNHHPDIHIYYNKVKLELSTHKIGGLSKNDFILAAKINRLV